MELFGLKLDMNKAYDRVEWNFLESILRKMGFQILGLLWSWVVSKSHLSQFLSMADLVHSLNSIVV